MREEGERERGRVKIIPNFEDYEFMVGLIMNIYER
jgi:hypothetical protein